MKITKIVGIIILLLLLKTKASAQGSLDTTITGTPKSVYLNTHVPTFDPGAYVKGFVSITDGFYISSGSTLSIGTVAPVGGYINLNGGTLILTDHLHLDDAIIVGPGTINPNGYKIYFGPFTTFQTGTIVISSNGFFEGNGGRINMSTATLDFSNNSAPIFRNLIFDNITSTSFIFNTVINISFSLTLDGVTFNMSPNAKIMCPTVVYLYGACVFYGRGGYVSFPAIGTIGSNASLTIGSNVTLHGNDPYDSYGFVLQGPSSTNNSTLQLDNATLEFQQLTNAILTCDLVINGDSTIVSLDNKAPLAVGGATKDQRIIINPGSTLNIAHNTRVVYNGIN